MLSDAVAQDTSDRAERNRNAGTRDGWFVGSWPSVNAAGDHDLASAGEVFVARQPIFDHRLRVVGYELLFRDGPADSAIIVDHQAATATVVLNSITEIGFEQVVGALPAWINVSWEFLRNGLVRLLPPAPLVLEILEDQLVNEAVITMIAISSSAVTDSRSMTSMDPGHRAAARTR